MGRFQALLPTGRPTERNGPVDAVDAVDADAETAPPADSGDGRDGRSAFAAFVAIEGVALVFLMWVGRGLWFWADEWDYLAKRTAFDGGDLIQAHAGAHLSPLPILAYRLMWWIVGLRAYWPYRLMIVALHLGGAALLWVVMRRARVRPWTATIVATLIVFFGRGFHDILWPFQITLVGSLVFGLLQLLYSDHDGPFDRRDWIALVFGIAAVLCSAVGVTMALAVGLATLIRRGWWVAVRQAGPPVALYLIWLLTIARDDYDAARTAKGTGTISQIVDFARGLMQNTFDAFGRTPVVSIGLVIVLVVGLVISWQQVGGRQFRTTAAAPLGLLGGAVAFAVSTGVQRSVWGPPTESRYLYVVAFLLIPAFGLAADALMTRWRYLIPVVLVLLLVGLPGNIGEFSAFVDRQRQPQQEFRQMVLSTPHIANADQVPDSRNLQAGPEPCNITMGWLRAGAASGRIPNLSHANPAQEPTDALRMSLVALPACFPQSLPLQKIGAKPVCVAVERGTSLSLQTGQTFTVADGFVRIVPATGVYGGVYPYIIPPTRSGHPVVATAPIDFRVYPDTRENLLIAAGSGGQIKPPKLSVPRDEAPRVCAPPGAITTSEG